MSYSPAQKIIKFISPIISILCCGTVLKLKHSSAVLINPVQIKAVTSCSTHKIDQQRRQMAKILKYDNLDHKIKLKIRQFQVMGKSTGQINNIGYKWHIGS